MCFYQHRAHPDPLIYPGLQDITAFVDFDAFADGAIASGFTIMGMTTQAKFLMRNGLLDLMPANAQDELQQLALAQQVKTLTLPGEMGDKFKVVGVQKGINLQLNGL
jgi:SAM-dependent MidA family methyltransferase